MEFIKALYDYYLVGFPALQESYPGFSKLKGISGGKMDSIAEGKDLENQVMSKSLTARTERNWENRCSYAFPSFLYVNHQEPVGSLKQGEEMFNLLSVSLVTNCFTFFQCKSTYSPGDTSSITAEISGISDATLKLQLPEVVADAFVDAVLVDYRFLFNTIVEGCFPYSQDYGYYKMGMRWPLFDYLFFDHTILGNEVRLKY